LQQDLKKVRNLIDIQIASQADLPMSARAKKRSLQHISS
jgi:hypothetical protein